MTTFSFLLSLLEFGAESEDCASCEVVEVSNLPPQILDQRAEVPATNSEAGTGLLALTFPSSGEGLSPPHVRGIEPSRCEIPEFLWTLVERQRSQMLMPIISFESPASTVAFHVFTFNILRFFHPYRRALTSA